MFDRIRTALATTEALSNLVFEEFGLRPGRLNWNERLRKFELIYDNERSRRKLTLRPGGLHEVFPMFGNSPDSFCANRLRDAVEAWRYCEECE